MDQAACRVKRAIKDYPGNLDLRGQKVLIIINIHRHPQDPQDHLDPLENKENLE
jgi:hypothetical protein